MAFKSAITYWICERGFSFVGGGVKGCSVKLVGGVVFFLCAMEACDVDIAICCAASRSCTVAVA